MDQISLQREANRALDMLPQPERNQPERIRAIHRQGNGLTHGHRAEQAPRAECAPIFNFYLGKNTPERKDYIMDKRVVPVEE